MITHLAISGGGSSGIKFAGSLKYLEETKQLCNVETILGTSIGAIIGVLLSYCTVDSIIKIMKTGNFNKKIYVERATEVGLVAKFFNYLAFYVSISCSNYIKIHFLPLFLLFLYIFTSFLF